MRAVFARTPPTVMQHFGCNADDAQAYLDLREEGHSAHAAALMAGLADPPDNEPSEQGQALHDAYAEGRKDEREEWEVRIAPLLRELEVSEYLSEQQCAELFGVDLLGWRYAKAST